MTIPNLKPTIDAVADPFADLANLRLPQDFAESVGVKKLLTVVPVRKPGGQDFVRVHPDAAFRENVPVIELKDDREFYVVGRAMQADLSTECVPLTLFTAINRQGVLFLWPIRLPGPDGKSNEWWRSSREAAELAMTKWVRIKANMSLGANEIFAAESVMQDPTWPALTFNDLLRIAFRDRIIDTADYAVVKRLRGLA